MDFELVDTLNYYVDKSGTTLDCFRMTAETDWRCIESIRTWTIPSKPLKSGKTIRLQQNEIEIPAITAAFTSHY